MHTESARTHFDRGLRHLDRYFMDFVESELARATSQFRSAVRLDPKFQSAWVALAWAHDASDRPLEALAALERAADLAPDDEEVQVFIVTLRSESGPEPEALTAVEALANRLGVDLTQLRVEMEGAQMPIDSATLLKNGFIRARNFVRSRLSDEIDRSERQRDPARWARDEAKAREECTDAQRRLEQALDATLVPPAVRPLVPWAARLGVGDAECGAWLLERLTDAERNDLDHAADQTAAHAHAWLDSFGDQPLSEEGAALLFLLLALEAT